MSAAASSSSSAAAAAAAASGSNTAPNPNSAELMIALSQIQQLIPLLDYRPGGLTHLLPTLLTPLMPINETIPGETMQRYRANVDHAFRVASELVGRVSDGSSVGSALTLAERLMREGDEKARILRVRKKRRLFVEQEKVLEVNSWGPPVPPRASATATSTSNSNTTAGATAAANGGTAAKKTDANQKDTEGSGNTPPMEELCAFLPSQNPPNILFTKPQQDLQPPKTVQAVNNYLVALHSYLKTAHHKNLFPTGINLKHIKARVIAFTPASTFSLEVQVGSIVKAVIDATTTITTFPSSSTSSTTTSAIREGENGHDPASEEINKGSEVLSIELAGLTVGGVNETITSTTPSGFPIFRSLSSDILSQTARAVSPPPSSLSSATSEAGQIWSAYLPITEAVSRIILAAAQFQA